MCDIRLPDVTGVQILNYCADRYPSIYRVAITASFDRPDALTAQAYDASDLLLRKPDEVGQLVQAISEWETCRG